MLYKLHYNNSVETLRNRKQLLKAIKKYHAPMYYCTNGAYNYNCITLIKIFNQINTKNNDNNLYITCFRG